MFAGTNTRFYRAFTPYAGYQDIGSGVFFGRG
jgi:hypothetical protein